MQERWIDACKNLPASHPLQPPMIDYTGTNFVNIDVSSSHPNSPTQTTQTTTETYEPSIIQNLVNHYSGELPKYETNQDKAFDITSSEVMTESPQQHEPNQDIASSTNIESVLIPDHVAEQNVPELVVLNKS